MKNLLINWSLKINYRGEYFVTGEIHNDECKRFADGSVIFTSPLKAIDFENKKKKTSIFAQFLFK